MQPKSYINKYHNDLHTAKLGKFSAAELDVFFSICSQMKNQYNNELSFSFSDIRSLSSFSKTSNSILVNTLKKVNTKLLTLQLSYEDEHEIIQGVLFQTFKTNTKTETLTVKTNEQFIYMLNNVTDNFTRYELNEFVTLSGKYTKLLYLLLKQFRTEGYHYISLDEFRDKLDIPKSYRMTNIDEYILEPALEKLNPLFSNSLHLEKIKSNKKGSPVIALKFCFKKESRYEPTEIENKIIERNNSIPKKKTKSTKVVSKLSNDWLEQAENNIPIYTKNED